MYQTYQVIRWNNVTALIVERDAQGATIMVEDGKFGVALRWYSTMALYRFAVIG